MPPVFVTVPQPVSLIIYDLILREGGYVHDPSDSGGETKYGITRRSLDLWDITMSISSMTVDIAEQIYYQHFWENSYLYNFGNYWWTKEFMFDWLVHSGPRNSARHLQRYIGVKADGVIGPVTMGKFYMKVADQGDTFPGKLCDYRIKILVRLARRRPKDIRFLEGWFNRVTEFRYKAVPYN